MRVRAVRVAHLPGGLSIFVDDQPDGLIIWMLEEDYSAEAAVLLESAFNTVVCYWTRKPATDRRRNLRAV
jgi:hypothetical protein